MHGNVTGNVKEIHRRADYALTFLARLGLPIRVQPRLSQHSSTPTQRESSNEPQINAPTHNTGISQNHVTHYAASNQQLESDVVRDVCTG